MAANSDKAFRIRLTWPAPEVDRQETSAAVAKTPTSPRATRRQSFAPTADSRAGATPLSRGGDVNEVLSYPRFSHAEDSLRTSPSRRDGVVPYCPGKRRHVFRASGSGIGRAAARVCEKGI